MLSHGRRAVNSVSMFICLQCFDVYNLCLQHCFAVAVNSLTLKATLRSHNRELARALEQKQAELCSAQTEMLRMRAELHALNDTLRQLRMADGSTLEQVIEERVAVSGDFFFSASSFFCGPQRVETGDTLPACRDRRHALPPMLSVHLIFEEV